MELAQLQAFLQVAQHRSFSRAAEALFLTQPSVTARIQSLERELGERLFERSGRTVTLTDGGDAFLPHARRALSSVQEGADAIQAVRDGDLGSVRLGASESIATYVLPKLIKRYREAHPGVHIHLSTAPSEDVIEELLAGDLNLAVTRLTQHPLIQSYHLYNDDLALAVPADHPFAQRRTVTIAEASGEPFLFFERNFSYHSLIYNMFLRAGVVPEPAMELDSMETTKRMVEAGVGVAILPSINIETDVAEGRIAAVEMTDMAQPAQREIGAHLLREYRPAPAMKAFIALLGAEFNVDISSAGRPSDEGD